MLSVILWTTRKLGRWWKTPISSNCLISQVKVLYQCAKMWQTNRALQTSSSSTLRKFKRSRTQEKINGDSRPLKSHSKLWAELSRWRRSTLSLSNSSIRKASTRFFLWMGQENSSTRSLSSKTKKKPANIETQRLILNKLTKFGPQQENLRKKRNNADTRYWSSSSILKQRSAKLQMSLEKWGSRKYPCFWRKNLRSKELWSKASRKSKLSRTKIKTNKRGWEA